ncbi:MAG: SDR family oxidoreductase [Myxococcales bacterium]|nr:SDR family oxidoreductase [Myxococcales bacterium]
MPSVLITGAGRGLGWEFARQYRRDGWRVVATVRDAARASSLRQVGAEAHLLDVTDATAIAALGRTLDGEAIDVLIANAGINPVRDMRLDGIDHRAWEETFRVNAIAPLALAAALREQVRRSAQRKLIAIGSALGSITANAIGGHYVYRSSKAALDAAWRSLARDEPDLIAVVLSPGWVRTDMGGARAPLSPEESVVGLRRVIAGLGPADSGTFLDHLGAALPW